MRRSMHACALALLACATTGCADDPAVAGDAGASGRAQLDAGRPERSDDDAGFEDAAGAPDAGDGGAAADEPGALPVGAVPLALVIDRGEPVLGYVEWGTDLLKVIRHVDGAWTQLGEALQRDSTRGGQGLRLAQREGGPLFAAWVEGDSVYAAGWDGATWAVPGERPLSAESSGRSLLPALAIDASGTPFTAWREGEHRLRTFRLDAGQWTEALDPWTAEGVLADIELFATGDELRAVVVLSDGDRSELLMLRADVARSRWAPCPQALELARDSRVRDVSAAERGGRAIVAWEERDAHSSNVYVAQVVADGCGVDVLGEALDLDLDRDALDPVVGLDADANPVVAWVERSSGSARVLVARWADPVWHVLGETLGEDARRPLLAVEGEGDPWVAWIEDPPGVRDAQVRRIDASRVPPFGLGPVSGASPCAIPPESDPAFPSVLSDTGCFLDREATRPAPGVVPYDVRSPLWSDGARKRRFVVVPAGEALAYDETGAWGVPAGTLFIKEFSIEREPGDPSTLHPVETRFLVKRCDLGVCPFPWQGYSYRWDEAGREAVLLDNRKDPVLVEWPNGDGTRTHTHVYPSRTECMKCHVPAAGSVLGLQTGQLNHPHDYDGIVDNQLRAWRRAGLLAGAPDWTSELPKLARPNDPALDLDGRVRSYLHANCAHCHRPDGSFPVLDLRFEADLERNGNGCDHIVPGDPDASLLYLKDSAREPDVPPGLPGDPMPPLASLLPDTRQLALTRAWIARMRSCPP